MVSMQDILLPRALESIRAQFQMHRHPLSGRILIHGLYMNTSMHHRGHDCIIQRVLKARFHLKKTTPILKTGALSIVVDLGIDMGLLLASAKPAGVRLRAPAGLTDEYMR